jgi:anti-anti-sigma factor
MQVAVVRLAETEYGSHDTAKLAWALRLLLDQAEKADPRCLVVDLSKVHYFGAGFIAILVSTWNQLRKRNRRLALCGTTPFCTALIQNLQLHRLFDIYPTQRIALEEIERHVQAVTRKPEPAAVLSNLADYRLALDAFIPRANRDHGLRRVLASPRFECGRRVRATRAVFLCARSKHHIPNCLRESRSDHDTRA